MGCVANMKVLINILHLLTVNDVLNVHHIALNSFSIQENLLKVVFTSLVQEAHSCPRPFNSSLSNIAMTNLLLYSSNYVNQSCLLAGARATSVRLVHTMTAALRIHAHYIVVCCSMYKIFFFFFGLWRPVVLGGLNISNSVTLLCNETSWMFPCMRESLPLSVGVYSIAA